jgi:FtsP/CotA-like multicopper oxidase with cupredoxin domain
MPFPGPVDRRHFLSGGAGIFLCTIAGKRIAADGPEPDWDKLAAQIPEPPKVREAELRQLLPGQPAPAPVAAAGVRREYWITAEAVKWTIVPTKRDQMMDKKVPGKTKFTAWCYRQYTANFAAPMGPASMPGPLLEAETGDTLVVNFKNTLTVPVTMHPHGVLYSQQMDGAYKGKFTDPGGFVKPGKTFQYSWDCKAGTEGVWPYHDHGPMDPAPLYKGLFGAINVRKKGAPRPDVDHYIFFNSLLPGATGLSKPYQCINGRSYAGNTPTLTAKVGQRVAQHVIGMSNDFHTYHLHGHRWTGPDGRVVDNVTVGPADSYSLEFVEDNAGRWFYHCHVFSHLHEGMNGFYVVDP